MRIPLLLLPLLLPSLFAAAPAGEAPRWYKGNTHTHSLWSDGDDYPEMIADWYKREGYEFLALSDHNILSEGTRWFELKAPVSLKGEVVQRGGGEVLQKYLRRFGPDWVELRENAGRREVRLKPLAEFAPLLNEPGKFLLIPAEEITGAWTRPKSDTAPALTGPVHINVTNPRDLVPAVNAADAVTVMQRTLEAVDAQRARTGQPMFAHLNHPNFRWGVTAEEMMRVERLRFFEVYNGHPGVENAGDATRLSMDAMWDAILAFRLSELNFGVVYGVATDDSHHYHKVGPGRSSSGRGWVMVRARHLTAESLIRALEAGDFYGTSGVTLREVVREPGRLAVEVEPEAGVSYRIQFIGTRRGFDRRSEEMSAPADEKPARRTLNHRRYSSEIGTVFAENTGPRAEYRLKGDELYVRAKVISSKPKADGSAPGEWETAWVQPVVGSRP